MDGQTNFYIKLPVKFFDRMAMIDLFDEAGYEGQIIYMKLMLLTAETAGVLAEFRDDGTTTPYTARTIRYLIHGHKQDAIQKTLDALVLARLAKLQEDGTYVLLCMNDGGEYVGKDTGAARRMRQYRAAKKAQGEEVDPDDIPQEEVAPQEEPKPKDTTDYVAEFETLWSIYPRKEGKQKAFGHYKAARKSGVDMRTIEAGIKAYLREIDKNKKTREFIKTGSTYFCGRHWEDEYDDGSITAKEIKQHDDDYSDVL